jgi:DNA-binding IclR family transcriptional regulator
MTGDGKRTYNIMALQRGLKLLSLFAKAEGGLTATQVAKLSGLPIARFIGSG